MFRPLISVAALATSLLAMPAFAGKTLDDVKKKGVIACGVNTSAVGFSSADSKGQWSGIDVDFCRAVAAAVLKDATKVKFVPLNSQQRFAALQAGEVDLLARNTTLTLTRDASLGLTFVGVNYYDGQGFMLPKKLKIDSATKLGNATFCVQAGTSSERNLADYYAAKNAPGAKAQAYKSVVFDTAEAVQAAFFSGRCQVLTSDISDLVGGRSRAAKPDDYMILPEVISKEPLGPAVRRGDDEWASIVKWTLYAMQEAEELGIAKTNVAKLKTDSVDPTVQRFLGVSEDTGKLLGLDRDWTLRIISQVGNYGESFAQNMGEKTPLGLPRGVNKPWNQGGLMYAMPIR